MVLAGLAPMYGCGRRLLENTLACFQSQTYTDRRLLIYDDGGNVTPQTGDRWHLVSTAERQPSMSDKYNTMIQMAMDYWPEVTGFVVIDVDDVYLPWHFETHATTLNQAAWSQPSEVWADLYGFLHVIETEGRYYHGSIAIGRALLLEQGGWPLTREDNFDLQQIRRLAKAARAGRTNENHPNSYVFRGVSSGAQHLQSYCDQGNTAYQRYQKTSNELIEHLVPTFDRSTQSIYDALAAWPNPEGVTAPIRPGKWSQADLAKLQKP